MQIANKKIGFIGIGVMGTHMAGHLLKGGCRLAVYNRTKEKAIALLDSGAEWKDSAASLASWADVIFTIVGYPADVEEVYFGDSGILENAATGCLFVDMTTTKPSLSKRIYEAAKQKGQFALDAPVSGGDSGARDAKLTIMVGGDQSVFETAKPLLEMMGENINYLGTAGSGQLTKLCNQIAIAANIMGVCESMAFAVRAGLDPFNVLKSISAGAAASSQLSIYAPRMLNKDFQAGFYIKHFIKDMTIALEEAELMGLETPALKLAKSLYDSMQQADQEDLGTQALYKLFS